MTRHQGLIRNSGLRVLAVALIGMLSVFIVSAEPTKVAATAMSTTWSCAENVDGGSRGRLYQSVSGGGSLSLYSYSGGSGGTWDLDLQATFSLPSGKTINALSLTPSGQMYGVLQIDGSASDREHQLVRLYPPASVGGSGSYQVVASYQHVNRTDKSINAGAYIEIGNEGYLLMSNNGGGINAALYNLSTGEWFDYDMNGQGVVKDMTWLPEPVTHGGVTYIGVGIEENNGNKSVLYAADGSATSLSTSLSGFSFDSSKGWGAAASYEATGSTASAVLLVRNDGILAEWDWNGGSPTLTSVGSAISTNDNDGASCGSTSLITTITSVDTWDPTVGFELDCDSDALAITVTNSGSTVDGELSITKNDSELTWSENGYPVIDAGATQTWSAAVTEAEAGAVYEVTVNPPFGSGFDAVTGSFTYDADCVQSCSKPSLTHSIVLFGDGGANTEYVSSNHTFGSAGDMYGLAIDGSAQFPNYSTSFTSTGITNYITGGYTGMLPTANGGSWSASGFPYNQQEWIDYANALADAAEADPGSYPYVRVYRLNGGTMSITNDGPDYPDASVQPLHVAVGSGTLRTTQMQNDKTDGAILAPEALVDVNKQIGHIDGWVVAKRFVESYAISGSNINNTGLQIHGQDPDAFVEVCTTGSTTTTTTCLLYTSPSPRDGLLSRMPSSA